MNKQKITCFLSSMKLLNISKNQKGTGKVKVKKRDLNKNKNKLKIKILLSDVDETKKNHKCKV